MQRFRNGLVASLGPGIASIFDGIPGRLIAAAGGGLGIGCVAWVSLWLAQVFHLSAWLAAPVGASAVLVFTTPASPFAQPFAVIGGNTVSALAGILAVHLIHDPVIAAGAAVGLAITAMAALRCLHPSGGGVALLCVLQQVGDPLFALFPTAVNSALLVATTVVYNNFVQGRAYPIMAAKSDALASE